MEKIPRNKSQTIHETIMNKGVPNVRLQRTRVISRRFVETEVDRSQTKLFFCLNETTTVAYVRVDMNAMRSDQSTPVL
jgi:hydroxyacyl-ACP dehydratase HTD2-like protein with hotdog domain